MLAKRFGCIAEQIGQARALQRRQWIFAAAIALKWITVGDDLAVKFARFTGNARDLLKTVVKRLQLIVGDASVLQDQALSDLILAVTLYRLGVRL